MYFIYISTYLGNMLVGDPVSKFRPSTFHGLLIPEIYFSSIKFYPLNFENTNLFLQQWLRATIVVDKLMLVLSRMRTNKKS